MKSSRPQIRTRRRSGFTLLELLIVLAIILVIAGMVVPNLVGQRQQANIDATKITLKNVEGACKMWAAQHDGNYPTQDDGDVLTLLTQRVEYRGKQLGPYLEEPAFDAWGKALHYEYPNTKNPDSVKPAIWSDGPNGADDGGTGDDVNNWVIEGVQ